MTTSRSELKPQPKGCAWCGGQLPEEAVYWTPRRVVFCCAECLEYFQHQDRQNAAMDARLVRDKLERARGDTHEQLAAEREARLMRDGRPWD